jgi:hypothetical protein
MDIKADPDPEYAITFKIKFRFFSLFTKFLSFISEKDVKCSSLTKVNVFKLIKVSGNFLKLYQDQ